jgi:uncharacterized beta-barrel protein YwiB (DUF1934 family)
MKKKVMLSIVGNRYTDQEDDIVELITEGSYYKDGDAYVLQYQESALSGMEGTTTTLRVQDDTVTMEREGTYNSHFVFKNGHFFLGSYSTPLGDIQVGMFPTHMDFSFGEDSGRLDLEYKLDLSGEETLNQILVSFKSGERPFA